MTNGNWEKFEASGQIEYYMRYKHGETAACAQEAETGANGADNYNNGACAAGDQNRGEQQDTASAHT